MIGRNGFVAIIHHVAMSNVCLQYTKLLLLTSMFLLNFSDFFHESCGIIFLVLNSCSNIFELVLNSSVFLINSSFLFFKSFLFLLKVFCFLFTNFALLVKRIPSLVFTNQLIVTTFLFFQLGSKRFGPAAGVLNTNFGSFAVLSMGLFSCFILALQIILKIEKKRLKLFF